MFSNMENLVAGDLRIEVGEADGSVRLDWKGKSNDRQPSKILVPYFKQVLAQARERGATVEMHFEKLDHFNSSTITAIIQTIQEARNGAVKLVLVYDQSLKWQKLSFDALRVFAKDELLQLRSA